MSMQAHFRIVITAVGIIQAAFDDVNKTITPAAI